MINNIKGSEKMNQYQPTFEKFYMNNIQVILLETPKFKNIYFETIFQGRLTKENAANKNLLSRLLEVTNNEYKSKEAVANKSFDLYDASVNVTVGSSNEILSLNCSLDIIDYRLLDKSELIYEALKYYRSFMFNPHIENSGFINELFEEEKRNVLLGIKRIYNNNNQYAYKRLIENMCENENVAIPLYGSVEDIERITPESLYQEYLKIIDQDKITVLIGGNITKEDAVRYLEVIFDGYVNHNQGFNLKAYDDTVHNPSTVKTIEETKNINQSILVMGFRTNISVGSSLSRAAVIFNEIFGGAYDSMIVNKIRGELSMAYSIGSSYDNRNGIIFVSAGIDGKNYDIVRKSIYNELDKMKSGMIDKSLFDNAITWAVSSLKQSYDSLYEPCGFYYRQEIYQLHNTMEEAIEGYQKITVEDVIKVANQIKLDTVFLLRGDKDEEN